ncbi:MAG TPA: SulP family inorganic anion transporter, partial [Propionibacteriaceae bacterium]|nr:SulP family inorganic anion transporter [Propionibacteriaceae bacterium]
VVGTIPRGLPDVALPHLDGLKWWVLLPSAVGIAVVGYSDNVLTGRAFAVKRRQSIDPNQEFLALGLSNLASGVTGGFAVSSSGSRTVLGDAMGSRTQVYSLVALLGVLGTLFFLGPVLENFPAAALGAIVIYAAIRLVDVAEWRRIARFRRSESILALVTVLAVVALGVLAGIGVAIVLSVLDLLRRLAKPHDGILGYVPGLAGMHDIDDYPEAVQLPGLVVYRYDSPLFFANADNFSKRALKAVDDAPAPVRWFLLNAEANVEVDLTAVDELDEVRQALSDQGIIFAMARVKTDLKDQLEASGFLDKVGDDRVFPTLPTAVTAYREWYARESGGPPLPHFGEAVPHVGVPGPLNGRRPPQP